MTNRQAVILLLLVLVLTCTLGFLGYAAIDQYQGIGFEQKLESEKVVAAIIARETAIPEVEGRLIPTINALEETIQQLAQQPPTQQYQPQFSESTETSQVEDWSFGKRMQAVAITVVLLVIGYL